MNNMNKEAILRGFYKRAAERLKWAGEAGGLVMPGINPLFQVGKDKPYVAPDLPIKMPGINPLAMVLDRAKLLAGLGQAPHPAYSQQTPVPLPVNPSISADKLPARLGFNKQF